MRPRALVYGLPAALIAISLAGCDGDETSGGGGAPPPPPPLPLPPPPPPQQQPPPLPPPQQPPPPPQNTQYPLDQAQALASANAGRTVAGRYPSGGEVTITQVIEQETVEEPVQKPVCEPTYDYDEERTVTKCQNKTVYERKTRTKTSYRLGGALYGTFRFAEGAMAQATSVGVTQWRLVR